MVKISVIIPCYNNEKHVAECLDSVLSQAFEDWEAIVINDGSSDGSLAIIKKYVAQFAKIKLLDQSNQGVILARNNAIKIANGEYIYPLDADDKIIPSCLHELYMAMIAKLGDVITGETSFFGAKTGTFHLAKPTKFNMLSSNRIVVSSLFKKKDWEQYGGYDINMKAGYEDWDFWMNFVYDNKKIHRINKVLFYYRIIQKSRNRNIATPDIKQLKKYMYQKYKNKYPYLPVYYYLEKIKNFLYQNQITQSNKRLIKIGKIPIYSKKIEKE